MRPDQKWVNLGVCGSSSAAGRGNSSSTHPLTTVWGLGFMGRDGSKDKEGLSRALCSEANRDGDHEGKIGPGGHKVRQLLECSH